MLDLVEKSAVGDCIEDLAEVEYQQVRLLSSIQSSRQVLYCVEQLGFAGVVCSESTLEFDEVVVPVKVIHYLTENNMFHEFTDNAGQ